MKGLNIHIEKHIFLFDLKSKVQLCTYDINLRVRKINTSVMDKMSGKNTKALLVILISDKVVTSLNNIS